MLDTSFVAVNSVAPMRCRVNPEKPWRAWVGSFEIAVIDGILGFIVTVVNHGQVPETTTTVVLPWLVERTTVAIPEDFGFITVSRLRIHNAKSLPERDGTNGLGILLSRPGGLSPFAVGVGLHKTVKLSNLCGALKDSIQSDKIPERELDGLRYQLQREQEV